MPTYDLDRVSACSRRFLTENPEDAIYRFGGTGTLFLVKSDSQIACVTARHVIQGTMWARIRILTGADVSAAVIPSGWWTQDSNEACFKDLSIGNINSSDWPQLAGVALPFDRFSIEVGRESFRSAGELIVSGFPSELQDVDFDHRIITDHRVKLSGHYGGLRDSARSWIHVMEVPDRNGLNSFDGISGSPIFGRGTSGSWGLAGMAIQGTGRIHFIDSLVLWEAMRKIAAGMWSVQSR